MPPLSMRESARRARKTVFAISAIWLQICDERNGHYFKESIMKQHFGKPFMFAAIWAFLPTLQEAHAQQPRKTTTRLEEKKDVWEIDSLLNPIPLNRSMFTDNILKQVQFADRRDGSLDNVIETEDTTISRIYTNAMLKDVPHLMIVIENLDVSHQDKIFYHKALAGLAKRLNNKPLNPDNALYIKKSVANFEGLLRARLAGSLDKYVKDNDNIYTFDNLDLYNDRADLKAYIYGSMARSMPEMMIKRLPEFVKEPYADVVISAAARVLPGTIMTYATSTSALGSAVRRNTDPLVKAIVKIADGSKSPFKALPFLEEIERGDKSLAEIDAVMEDPNAYYKALVALKTKGPSITEAALDQELAHRGLQFVRVVNELHDSPAPVRFKSLMDFNAEELYFMILASQEEIYTSSFVWMYQRMMEKTKPLTGQDLLDKVRKSHFRTFIRMCAGYNTLSNFLNTMDEGNRASLMKEFVANLEQGDPDNLEDAVNVADAFGSITDEKLIAFLKNEIIKNYEKKTNTKGVIVYGLLSTIFNSTDNAQRLNSDIGDLIPPITSVPIASLKNENGQIIQQIFFYGDKDGMGAYANYLRNFNGNKKWKVEQNEYWATITSTGNPKVVIYANKPLPEEEGLDEEAQKKLAAYMRDNDISPTIIIHRGHSYFLPTTLEYLTPGTKIVMLGSCGGYHNLSKVLDVAQDAHIISSKQVGALSVNMPIINAIDENLLLGKDIDWIEMWAGLSKYFSARGSGEKELFSDYIPPNKNLGAIFIKAYRKQSLLLNQY